ncbi:hypothetical protein MJ1_0116 [Nanobdella aerobiophila]|uniref:DUF371 domain-containing protein n=1 Tax=Nanobdella aerobiophila TaxID=2586965 RepID=A0A915SSC2_9ARCH|nr:DUF371 domain-containing protein [Nanobdella aerobiophila]BBL45291.1 hypothetical protein MJ1_0116 [Nanobdella aerobiophila]
MKFEIKAKGNRLIKATHKSTLEVTKDDFLTERGDCIIGINANFSASEIPEDLKEYLLSEGKIKIIIKVDNLIDKIIAYGSKNLSFKSENSIIIRKSNFIDDRTLAIYSNKSSIDIKRDIINLLKEDKDLYIIIKYL